MPIKPLTDRQKQVLAFVEGYATTNGFPPTLREIGDEVGLANVSAVRGHLSALEKKGYISRAPDKARSIRVIQSPSRLSRFLRKLHKIAGTDKGVLHRVVYALAWRTARPGAIPDGSAVHLIEQAFERECVERGWTLIEKEIRPDHVRLIVQVWPNHSPEQAMRRLKRAGNAVRAKHANIFRDEDLWQRGYVATTDTSLFDQLVGEMLSEPDLGQPTLDNGRNGHE